MRLRLAAVTAFAFLFVAFSSGCADQPAEPVRAIAPTSISEISAARLNYRYEADVPAPELKSTTQAETNEAVRAHFEQVRPEEFLDRTLTSPDGNRVLAIYHRTEDLPSEFRLDMYSPDGTLLSKLTSDTMAVHFPDTIVWSPDSTNVAFVAMIRGEPAGRPEGALDRPADPPTANEGEPDADATNTNVEPGTSDTNTNASPEAPAAEVSPTPNAPTGLLAFRTEQIYLAGANGENVRPLTQNEGLIYFYYAWSPDSSSLVALAATLREWQFLQMRAEEKGEAFIPVGRPRLIEQNGRERRLDDGLTAVRPVWSPDSAKVAAAYDTQIRLYDADGSPPTQAAVPLRNSLLLSSQAYDKQQQAELGATTDANNANTNANTQTNATPAIEGTLPDPRTLVSFNPIVSLEWPSPEILYFQTAFVKRMLNQADSATSFSRWHRIILSVQPQPVQAQ